jgi:hypothetical protein
MRTPAGRVKFVLVMTAIGFVVGWVGSSSRAILAFPARFPFLAEYAPLPHHVPEHKGGLSFRFAMAHDVLLQRFPKHGPAHYEARDRITREALAALEPDDPARLPLMDDLAAGLDRLGRPGEAVVVMRAKLAMQQGQGIEGRDLYTTYANLGTFLIHDAFAPAIAGDSDARGRFAEGVAFIRRSVEVNPEAHFGRERWQAAIAEFLLAATDDPSLLTTFDCLGNRLDLPIEALLNREINWTDTGYGRPTDAEFSQGRLAGKYPDFFTTDARPDDPDRWEDFAPLRAHITKVGAELDWKDDVPVPSHREPVPFDEPMLGIIGMWRQGGGANPHFALAIGETMLRVGQRSLAWTAFERASRMADRFWPDPELQKALVDHCRARQRQIEETFLARPDRPSPRPTWQEVSPPPDPALVARLREQFDTELAFGESYQRAYQQFEADRIAAGVPITAPGFFDAFHAEHPPIASPSGPEEWFAWVPPGKIWAFSSRQSPAWGLFVAGIAATLAAGLARWWAGPLKPSPGAELA